MKRGRQPKGAKSKTTVSVPADAVDQATFVLNAGSQDLVDAAIEGKITDWDAAVEEVKRRKSAAGTGSEVSASENSTPAPDLTDVWDAFFGDDQVMADFARAATASSGQKLARGVNRSRPIKPSGSGKRSRRTKADIESLKSDLWDIVAENKPCTVRQIFYQAVSRGIVAKAEAEYKGTICRLLTDMRLQGDLPFDWIADNTRWMRKPSSFSTAEMAIKRTAEAYRRSVWDNQEVYVEIWLEKDALAGVLYQETAAWDVPLMVTRGYPSVSYLYEAAQTILAEDKPTYLYYFGDWDPSGVDIPRNVETRIREFAPESEIYFERVAVNEDQIEELQLPTRPTKKGDSRSAKFEGESVEVDAIPPKILRQMASECITQHIDEGALEVMRIAEKSEREWLNMIVQMAPKGAEGGDDQP